MIDELQQTTNFIKSTEDPLWHFVRLADYELPKFSNAETAFRGWTACKRLFGSLQRKDHNPFKGEAELLSLSEVCLSHLLLPIEWEKAATALDIVLLTERKGTASKQGVAFVAGQPFSRHHEPGDRYSQERKDGVREDPASPVSEKRIRVSEMPPEPVLPSEKDEDTALILHALLLHNGLPGALLATLLPLTHSKTNSLLSRLQVLGIMTLRDKCLVVTALGYSVVRHYLSNRGYLTDGFQEKYG